MAQGLSPQAQELIESASLTHLTAPQRKAIARTFAPFLDTVCTATKRSTFYNSVEEQEEAVMRVHDEMFSLDRGIYAITCMLPGVTDYARQIAIAKLLGNPRDGRNSLLPEDVEFKLLEWLAGSMPPHRFLKLVRTFAGQRVGNQRAGSIHNARTKRLILRFFFLNDNMMFWATKYRVKLRTVLQHAWGVNTAKAVGRVCARDGRSRTNKDKALLAREIDRYLAKNDAGQALNRADTYEAVAFVMGHEDCVRNTKLKAYVAAKADLNAGRGILPETTLVGLRNTFHKTTPMADVLQAAESVMSDNEKRLAQKKASKAGVRLQFDASKLDLIELYVYAFERGMGQRIVEAVKQKAKTIAQRLPMRFQKVAVVLDASCSMHGGDKQPLRPMAIALAARDVLEAMSVECPVFVVGGEEDGKLIRPADSTGLCDALLDALEAEPDAVFVISDGYENAPAGRFAEVMHLLRKKVKCETPVYHINPVMAAESGGTRKLAVKDVTTLPLSNPARLGLPMLRAMMESDVKSGLKLLAQMTLPLLTGNNRNALPSGA